MLVMILTPSTRHASETRAKSFSRLKKQHSAQYIKSANTELRQFCSEVGLEFDGVHYKAHLKVGQNAPRFKPVIDKLPDKPTTIDWLARIGSDHFQILEPHLKPQSKMRELRALLPPDSNKKRAKRKKIGTVAGWLLESAGPMDERTKSEVHEELKG
jgi:hypothetical protein